MFEGVFSKVCAGTNFTFTNMKFFWSFHIYKHKTVC